jgi:hypothetical protein
MRFVVHVSLDQEVIDFIGTRSNALFNHVSNQIVLPVPIEHHPPGSLLSIIAQIFASGIYQPGHMLVSGNFFLDPHLVKGLPPSDVRISQGEDRAQSENQHCQDPAFHHPPRLALRLAHRSRGSLGFPFTEGLVSERLKYKFLQDRQSSLSNQVKVSDASTNLTRTEKSTRTVETDHEHRDIVRLGSAAAEGAESIHEGGNGFLG